MSEIELSIVIVNWNTRDLLLGCLASVYHTIKEISFEVFIVDNGSTDGSVEAVKRDYPQAIIIQNEKNLGFAAANNQALRRISGKYALLLNTDAILTEGAVEKIFRFMESHPQAGMCCGQLLNADGTKQNSIANFPSIITLLCNETLLRILCPSRFPSKRREYRSPIQVESCIGACLMVRKSAMDEVGLLDERYFFFMEETDWALTMQRAGWRSWFVPDAHIYHLQGQSAGDNIEARKLFFRSRYLYFKKWCGKRYHLYVVVVLARIFVNFCLSLMGTIVTFGLYSGFRSRLIRYGQLLLWHTRGCP